MKEARKRCVKNSDAITLLQEGSLLPLAVLLSNYGSLNSLVAAIVLQAAVSNFNESSLTGKKKKQKKKQNKTKKTIEHAHALL